MPRLGMSGSAVMMLPWFEAMKTAIELGYEAFELFGEFPQCICGEVGRGEREQGRELVKSSGLELAVHAPFTSLNLAALNPGVRAESIRQTRDAIDLCAELGGSAVIVHNGEYVYRKRPETRPGLELQWLLNLEALRQCAAHARERGVMLCLENIGFEPEHLDRCVDDMLRIRELVIEDGGAPLFFCLDIGHARLNHELPEAIERMGPLVRHLHFTDNFGEKDDHVVIGEGNFDYSPHLDFFRGFDGIITLEVVKVGKDPEPARRSLINARRLFNP